ncbi:hypothetical protein, partial [Deinococcus sp.]|uniref:hypothetical protein n=1 Tax=Deinococcus sp. TaxID=47478 RepID=UPI0025D1310A
NVNGDTVGFYALGATGNNGGVGLLTVNDEEIPFSLTSKLSRDLPKGGRIDISGNPTLSATATVTWPDGNAAVILLQPEVFSFVTLYVPPAIQGTLQGLLGNADGNASNDFKGRDGTSYLSNPSFEQLYKGFGDSWRVQPAESLFRYGAGQSTATFTRLDFPPPPQPIAPPVLTQAEATCRAAGVTDAEAVKDCTFDVAVSQKPELAQSALQYDPNHPSLAVSPANTAVGAGQQVQLRASVQGKANLADVQWTTTGGTLSANVDGVVTLSAPNTVGQLTVTASVAGATSTAIVAVRSSAITATSSASAFVGQSIPLRADLLGDLAGKPLVWSAARGSVTPSGNAVTYTAPATPGDDTVTVQMQGDPAVSATIPVQVLGAQISLSPAVTEARVGEVIGFNVTYGGLGQATPTIEWSASGGTLTPGLGAARYTAPSQAGTYTVTATVQGRPDLQATARVVVRDIKLVLTPSEVSMSGGETRQVQGEITGLVGPQGITWTSSAGTLVPNGNTVTFTAPTVPGSYTITGSVVGYPEIKATVPVTVVVTALSVTPTSTTLLPGESTSFQSTVTGFATTPPLTWSASAGTLTPNGNTATFTAPRQAGPITVTVQGGGVQAQAQVTVLEPNLDLFAPWRGSEAVAFPGMQVSLVGGGLRPERAVWNATAGTLSATSGTNDVTFTTPTQPGEVTLSYSHSL